MRLLKRTLSAFLAFVMVFTMLPLQVWASETQQSANDSVNFGSIVADGADDDRALEEVGNDVDTYIFEVDGEKVSTQYVKAGEEVHEPAAPVKEGQKFMGWFDAEDNAFDASKVLTSMPNGTTYTYTAKYQQLYYVFFMDGTGDDAAVVYTQEGTPGALIKTDVTFDAGLDKGVAGWYYDKTYSRPVGANDLIGNENITLYPKIEGGHWIHFDTDGGEPIPSVFVKPDETTKEPEKPKREGYTFEGWYNGETKFTFDGRLNESVTLKAKWQGNLVKYKVFYWQQNADDNGYSFVEEAVKEGRAGERPNLRNYEKNYKHFHYKGLGVGEENKVIAGDGSTIINVYYDRDVYTVRFKLKGDRRYKDAIMDIDGRRFVGDDVYTFRAKFEQDISELWPTAGNMTQSPQKASYSKPEQFHSWYRGNTNYTSKRLNLTEKLVGNTAHNGTITFEADWISSGRKYDLHYMLESLSGDGNEDSPLYRQTVYTDNGSWSAKDILGFGEGDVVNKGKDDDRDGDYDVYFYYPRLSYKLTFYNFNTTASEESYKYEADISDTYFVPERPDGVNEKFQFKGWYTTEDCLEGTEFNFNNATMPAANLILYAKWAAEPVKVTVHTGMGAGSEQYVIEVPYGGKIQPEQLKPIAGAPEGHGWATYEQGKYLAFNLDRPLYADIEIFPYWISNEKFRVTYDLGKDVQGNVTDPNSYRSTAHAEVLGIGEDVEKPNGKIFLGWKQEGDKTLYRPGMKIQILNKDVKLTAVWGDVAQKTSLTYHPGYEGAEPVEEHWANNEMVTLKTPDELKFNRDGFEFLGWATSAGSEAVYGAGDTIRVNTKDADTNNHLYAVWKENFKQGDPIKVRVVKDGEEVNASEYVTVVVDEKGTPSLKAENTGNVYSLSYTYMEKNCADFYLNKTGTDKFTGYTVDVTHNGTPVEGAEPVIQDTNNGWHLDNIPGGATVTVSLNTQKFTVKYEVSPAVGGTVSLPSETVPYGENAKGSTATAKDGYYFVEWRNEKNEQVSTKAAFTPDGVVTENATYTAVFAAKKNVEVTITGNHTEGTYNGEKYTAKGYTVTIPGGSGYTENDIVFNGEDTAFGTDAGITYMGLEQSMFTNKNEKYNVTFNVVDGYVRIDPAEVTVEIEGHSDSKPYTGGKQKVEGYDVKIAEGSLYKEEYFTFTGSAVAEGTDVNTYPMGLKADQFVNKNDNFEVTFDVKDGALEITAIEDAVVVNIVGNHVIATYDGQGHEAEGYNVKIDGSTLYGENDFTFSGNKHASRTDAGITYMGLKAEDFQNTNKNFTNVTFSVAEGADGYVQIDPAEVTVEIKGHSDSKPYTGSKQEVEGYDVKIAEGSLYKEEYFTFTGSALARGTDVNTYPMGLKADQFVNNNDNFEVMFDVTDGALEITAIEEAVVVNIVGNHVIATYDGQEHEAKGYGVEVTGSTLYGEADFTFSGNEHVSRSDAGTTKMGLKAEDFQNTNKNFTNVTFNVVDGYVQIDRAKVTVEITGHSGSKPYTGGEQKVEGYDVKIPEGSLYKEEYFTFTGSALARGTDVNTYPMGLKADQFVNNNDNFEVMFDVTDGALEITAIEEAVVVNIVGNHDTMPYNGSEQAVTGYDVGTITIGDGDVETTLYTSSDFGLKSGVEAKASGKDANIGNTTYPMGLKKDSFLNNNPNFTNVKFVVTDGWLRILPKPISIEVADGVKTYGETNPEITVTANGLVNENDLGEIAYERGSKSENAGVYTDDLRPVYTPNPNYTVTEMPGTLTINKRQVALESESGEQLYNGKALTKPDVKIGDVEFVEGDVTEVKATGTQTLVGESDNTIEITWKDETLAGNYEISTKVGKLIVKAPGDLNGYVAKTHAEQDFKVGDKVTFKISVTNIYAVKATVTLKEEAGMTFENGLTTLEDVLDPGQTKTYTATHTLTDADFKNGVSNTVEVTLDPEGEEPEIPGTGTDEVELEEMPNMSVVKTVLNPKESYRVGDTIQYQIIVTNTGNVTLHDLELTDVMNADGKVTFPAGTDLTRKTLYVGDSWTVTCSYVVRAADEGKTISNTAKVISRDDDGNPNKDGEATTPGESVQKRYSLTIHYRNGAGNAVAGSYSARYHVGDSFKIDSPIVAGYYDPQIRSISSGANGMPAQDLEFVVIYTAIPVPAPDPGPGPAPNPGPDDGDDDDDTPPVPNPEQEQPPQPQDFEIDPDDYTLTELEDNETPLANLNLEGHTCCILHLLLMLAAMVVLGFDTKSRKKHQARIFELKKMLAMEEDHSDDPEQP